MSRFRPTKLEDCQLRRSNQGKAAGSEGWLFETAEPAETEPAETEPAENRAIETELFIVEGDSASRSVMRVRDARTQAVLPMQGKPRNAWKSRRREIAENKLYAALIDALEIGWGEDVRLENLRYDRVLLLQDPDADGIHCSTLLLLFFYRWMRPLLDAGHLWVVRPPIAKWTSETLSQSVCVYSAEHAQSLTEHLQERGITDIRKQHYRGLGSIDADTLLRTCLEPKTRALYQLSSQDAETALEIFAAQRPE